ncbi:hypothetical protein P0Y35_09360 [Kiritimatiellaeota bacterium B1221]|nr:hypothetical protein [Kiritimatiellaeota bacterium B1221]
MMSFLSPLILLALFFGGENSLSGYVNPENYWESRGVAYEVEALSDFLGEEPAEIDQVFIQQTIEKLGADTYAEREAASLALAGMGEAAQRSLQAASLSRDPEVARRAKDLLQKIESKIQERNPEEEWIALYSLARMEDPEAKRVVQKIAESPGSDLKASAQKFLVKSSDERILSPTEEAIAGFPADTRVIVQAQPWKGESEVLKRIYASRGIQTQLMELLAKTGDIKVHRISFGFNEGVFTQDQGKVLVRVDADYDVERFEALLKNSRYKLIEEKGSLSLYARRELTIVLSDNGILLFQLGFGRNDSVALDEFEAVMNGGGSPRFSKELLADYMQLAESSLIRGAGEFTEEMMRNLEDFSVVRKGQFQIETAGASLKMSLGLTAEDTETAVAFEKYAQDEKARIITLFEKENEEWIRPMLSLVETVEISEKDQGVNVSAVLTGEVLMGTVDLVEKTMLQIQEMRQRHDRNIRRQQIHPNIGNGF